MVIEWQSSVPGIDTSVYIGLSLKKESLVASVLPVVFHYVQIRQINTRLSLGHHWVLASASVVPVAPQWTCGSSVIPVCSNYANDHFWIATGRPLGGSIRQYGSS